MSDNTQWCAGCKERQDEIDRLREALESWLLANEVWEWLDDDVPLVKRSDEALKDE